MVFLVVLSYRSTLIHICILCILQNFPSNSDTAHHVKSKLNMYPTRRILKERLKNKVPTTLPTTYYKKDGNQRFEMNNAFDARAPARAAW